MPGRDVGCLRPLETMEPGRVLKAMIKNWVLIPRIMVWGDNMKVPFCVL